MSTFVLKLIACIAMLIDHMTKLFVDETSVLWTIGCGIGRLAFPIFCFLIVEGLFYTRDKRKYALRLLIAAIISEVPYDLMRFGTVWNFDSQNVIWTLLLGLLGIVIIEHTKVKFPGDTFKYNIFSCLAIFVCGCAALFCATDYSVYGVMLVVSFYMFRGHKFAPFFMLLFLNLAFYSKSMIQFAALLACPVLILYNGKKGPDDKYCLYAFYPVHMLLLWLLVRFVV